MTQREDPQLMGAQAPPGARAMTFLSVGAGLSILLVAYWVRTWQSLAVVRRICPVWFCDFVDYYYPMGEAVFRTGLPVDGFLYSPFIAILMAALPPLGLSVSLVIWGILEVLFVALYVLIFRRLVPAGLPIQLLFALLTVFSYPLVLNLMGGQVSLFIVVPLLAGLALYERSHRVAAAALGALAVSFKFYPVLFIAPFIGRRDARFVTLAAAAFVAVLLVVPGIFLGAGNTLGFYGALVDAFRDSGWVVTNPHSQFFPHVMLRPFEAALEDPGFPLALLRWISYGIAAANLGLVVLVQRARLRHADLWS
ncbi:MAG TPA: glycosyltransferase family 87 protein, partial [Gemmatimonadota bacterium]|nr:glycosyltransferase family 87 protein [Gemmatimonadota bacterium]